MNLLQVLIPAQEQTSLELQRSLQILAVIAVALVLNRVIREALRALTRRAVSQAEHGRSRWKQRLPRSPETRQLENRRLQRADATAHMLARFASVVIMGIAVLTISNILGFDALVLISSAGFIGAGFAIGGQSVIKDWLLGLFVLLEDRYAEGDHVLMRVTGEKFEGVVDSINSTSVRVRLEDGSMWHAGHGSVETVNNLSQRSRTEAESESDS